MPDAGPPLYPVMAGARALSMGGVRGRAPPARGARRGPRPQPPGPRLPAPGRPRGRSTQRVRSCGTWREISEVNIGYVHHKNIKIEKPCRLA